MIELDWVQLMGIALLVISLCGFFWRMGHVSGFDEGIEKGVEIGKMFWRVE